MRGVIFGAILGFGYGMVILAAKEGALDNTWLGRTWRWIRNALMRRPR